MAVFLAICVDFQACVYVEPLTNIVAEYLR